MMRSGFQKSGAIPFFALLIFSLLSLVPSLAKEWDYYSRPFAHIGYVRGEPRHTSRDKDGWVDVRSPFRIAGGQSKPWSVDDKRPAYLDSNSRPRQPPTDAPPRSSFEAAAILDSDSITYSVQYSSAFRRGVRALQALIIRKTDDSLAIHSFPAERDTASVDQSSPSRNSPYANSSAKMIPSHEEDLFLFIPIGSGDRTISDTTDLVRMPKWLLSCVWSSWQQACRVGNDYMDTVTGRDRFRDPAVTTSSNCSEIVKSEDSSQPRDSRREAHLKYALNSASATEKHEQAEARGSAALTQSIDALAQPSAAPTATTTAMEQLKVVEGQAEPGRVRSGSCMAIVLAIVAGVMWF
ncbi:uncharacterized protein BP01DRAFT_81438 [Aspergillus saccharolyticus JOP 1030-1]|uniref:GPI anchored protein n=1 Tax=Aspergillus saccharolyticus JOP 1030-1 TaxID=1450539 RepID=A0A318ZW63_9EURO|nr:hypothetical protein BP01DRAFT_81438 [Aspergillus saccharolyticus JOP 1030-1]PYH44378.1 hypothetical protein BP01DRAFT_81438 [Aspergillus saccharolyticus JOP 1030-1]